MGPHGIRNIRQRIGTLGLCILLIGTIAISAAFGFAAFFWVASNNADRGGQAPFVWSQVVTSGWAPRTVTLLSVVIRTGIALQAGLMAAMLASILIETTEVRLSKIPFLSINRSINVGPSHIA